MLHMIDVNTGKQVLNQWFSVITAVFGSDNVYLYTLYTSIIYKSFDQKTELLVMIVSHDNINGSAAVELRFSSCACVCV